MATFIIEHNLSIRVADHLFFGHMLPMCKTARDLSCKRTKTRVIIIEMGWDCVAELLKSIGTGTGLFRLSTDSSADKGFKHQLYLVLVRYYSAAVGKIMTEVLSIPEIKDNSKGQKHI